MTMMALTLWRPWSCAVVRGPKPIENRTWIPSAKYLGETFAIHGGKRWSHVFVDDTLALWPGAPQRDEDSPQGVVGVARYVGAIDVNEHGDPFIVAGLSGVHVDVDGGFWNGGRAWIFDERRPIAEPIQCRGAQGLWRLPDDIERQVRAQTGGVR